jgi:hypothetical protein
LLHLASIKDASASFFPHRKSRGRGIFEHFHAQPGSGKNNPAGMLDIVLTHFSPDTLEETARWWTGFLDVMAVKELEPAVYIYCQNPNITDLSMFAPLLRYGGRIDHLDNLGRESHAYLVHITRYYDQLPEHVLFSQDIPVDTKLWHRFQNMFEPKVGFLPLAIVGHQPCEDGWLPQGILPQLYSMFTNQLCPPEGFTAAYNGQFLVSRKRLRKIPQGTYQHLLELVAAPTTHWIHDVHNDTYYKRPDNPMFGHVLERVWSVAFDCFESWRTDNCYRCDEENGMQDCGQDACQCYDEDTS